MLPKSDTEIMLPDAHGIDEFYLRHGRSFSTIHFPSATMLFASSQRKGDRMPRIACCACSADSWLSIVTVKTRFQLRESLRTMRQMCRNQLAAALLIYPSRAINSKHPEKVGSTGTRYSVVSLMQATPNSIIFMQVNSLVRGWKK